jgi:hypothetical protein
MSGKAMERFAPPAGTFRSGNVEVDRVAGHEFRGCGLFVTLTKALAKPKDERGVILRTSLSKWMTCKRLADLNTRSSSFRAGFDPGDEVQNNSHTLHVAGAEFLRGLFCAQMPSPWRVVARRGLANQS